MRLVTKWCGAWLLGLLTVCWAAASQVQACEHELCEEGAALDANCDACVHSICVVDPYCCDAVFGAWDAPCVEQVMTVCGDPTCEAACEHGLCTAGEPLTASCNDCATKICDADPLCCSNWWDATCVAKVETECHRVSCVQGGDKCTEAVTVDNSAPIRLMGTLVGNTANGCSSLESSCNTPDAWYEYTVPGDYQQRSATTCGTQFSFGIDTLVSVHAGCPGNPNTEVTANDDWMVGPDPQACRGSLPFRLLDAAAPIPRMTPGATYKIRVTHYVDSAPNDYQIYLPEPSPALLRLAGLGTLFGLSHWRRRARGGVAEPVQHPH